METSGIADALIPASEAALRQGLIAHAQKRLADAEEEHIWLVSNIKPKNWKLADRHGKALDTARKVMASLNTDLPANSFVAVHTLLMDSMDRVAVAFGGALGWQGGKAGTGRSGGYGKIKKDGKTKAKAAAKADVKAMWKLWQDDPARYKGKAAFARDMLSKFPDDLSSQPVIEGWCRDWEKEKP